ncbi:beta-1,4-mannosyl-glycoprotein 4-beta-N-acetylglucosaminyltransferase [Chelonus insularis]|uniref:beta-1,4-mannosyl-glycoprotein 4-beta-N-acetylglucosaminyltransferase n=1 Tax=Chelonus insularis TaxID=460826 RepID=UPI00158BDE54|nr:beta-1,4-mannosyl-glycoprotein 4-beta-N-acetylglucosaminyltransferase [Chelonus insularis]
MQNRLDAKLILLYTLLVLQVFIVMIYVVSTPPAEYETSTTKNPVSFVNMETSKVHSHVEVNIQPTYKTIIEEFRLKDFKTLDFFVPQNNTLCWKEGMDMKSKEAFSDSDKCICKQGWHGSDCGQPEVVWRAIMASKQNIKLKRRRATRRLIYMFSVHDYNSAIAEVIVEELYHVVDLFVICDFSNSEDNFKHKLSKGLLKSQQNKILYINAALKIKKPKRVISKYIWDKIGETVKNIKEDDIYVTTKSEQILNWRALMFLKVYDGWPQPIGFRLRWSVFGFFWQHPSKTAINIGACTVGLIYNAFRTNSQILQQELDGESSERENLGLVIGDLNHYGGWYCHYCQSPAHVLHLLQQEKKTEVPGKNKIIDVLFIEDLIGSGVWIDGKTSLQRAYKSRDTYFAPETVFANAFKYDWLAENFYAKLDYY